VAAGSSALRAKASLRLSRRTEPAPRITLTGRYQSALPDPLPERGADRLLKRSAPDAAIA
jgi:hypothetical protein